jgi:hypothetical protein
LHTGTVPAVRVAAGHNWVAGEVDVLEKTTVPVGTAAPENAGVTVAVKATDWLTFEGFGDDTTPVVVEA